jgi:DNA primase
MEGMIVNAQIISEHLGGKKQGNSYLCHCPIHDDKNPSLQVSDSNDGKIRVYCHAKCPTKNVIEYLKNENLWPTKSQTARKRIIEVYPYTDENHELLFEVVRYFPKSFIQRSPDPSNANKFLYNVKGIKLVPFRLPNVLRAISIGAPIFLCEGEKDVMNIEKIGLTATCNSGGAGKWREEHSKYLKNANVVILPHNDDAGTNHLNVILKTISTYAHSIKILKLPNIPHKGDVSDWLRLNKG